MKAMRVGLIVLAVVAVVVIGLGVWAIGVNNSLVGLDQEVQGQWAQVQHVYQRRADLIPKLVDTVEGYAAHERAVLNEVTQSRANATGVRLTPEALNDPKALERFQAAQNQLTGALSRLLVAVQKYPDLKANQNFLALQTQLEGTENRITVERGRYNDVLRRYNTYAARFPGVVAARMLGYQPKPYFEASAESQTAPRV